MKKTRKFNNVNRRADEFRVLAITRHIIVEQMLNGFLTRYLFENKDGDSIFTDLILDELSFFKKYQTISTIFNKSTYHPQLKKLYSNFVFEKNKVVGLKSNNWKVLSSKKLIEQLEILKEIRNHLVHTFVVDTSSVLKNLKNSKIDMNLKGNRAQFKHAYRYIDTFFSNINLISKEKMR